MNNIGANQLAYYVLKNGNDEAEKDSTLDIIAFYEIMHRPCIMPNIGVMHINEAWGFSGVCIASTLHTAKMLLNMPGPKDKYFYIWDLEWLRKQPRRYEDMHYVYCDERLKLIARSKYHADLIKNGWNRDVVGIVDDFDISQLRSVIQ